MDSANSGSMQSSSGGDEEYDSSTHPQDNYLLNPQTNTLNHFSNTNPSNFLYSNDPFNNNNILQPFSHSPSTSSLYNTNNNIQDFWSSNPPNDQTIQTSYTPSQQQQQQQLANQSINLDRPLSNLPQSDNHQSSVSKNPKKRTRASRRAPTTVLTTDTSNFRQMVQEFTGIPAAPFSTATSAFSRRLDLFSAARGESLIYPLRPSAQKVANIQPSLYNSMANITTNSNIVSTTITPSSYQQSQQNVLNMQANTLLNYQSMLQSQHQEANTSQENSRNIPILDDDVEHFRSFSAPNVQLDEGEKRSYN